MKYGCALWDIRKSKKSIEEMNKLKPNIIKRVLQLPMSTPSDAVQYEFGVNDLSFDVMVEKIILAVETLNNDDERVAKKLLQSLMEKQVDGFSTELIDVCEVLNVSFNKMLEETDVRKKLKSRIIKVQEQELYKRMLSSSKMDGVLLNGFCYDGKVKNYLLELDFIEARAVFMMRYRMIPTKANFPGRWCGTLCNVCNFEDTDEHLFHCPGYQDLLHDGVYYKMFWDDKVLNDTVLIKKAACSILGMIERLKEIQGLKE